MVNWALCRLNGFGTARDEADGVRWLQTAAERGSATAMGMLGETYLRGRGVQTDARQAAGWLQKAVDAGDGPAIAQLGDLYERGQGVPRDARRAFGLYQRAAVAGDTDAMVRLGYAYEDGGDRQDVRPPPGISAPPSWGTARACPAWPSCWKRARACLRTMAGPPSTIGWRRRLAMRAVILAWAA